MDAAGTTETAQTQPPQPDLDFAVPDPDTPPAVATRAEGDDGGVGRWVAILLGLLTTLGPVSMDLYLPGLPNVSADLGLGRTEGAMTLYACLVGLAVGQVLWGPVIDRFGPRRPPLIAIALWCLCSVGCALAPNGFVLIGLRLVQGLTGGCGMTVAKAVLAHRLRGAALAAALAQVALVTNVSGVSSPVAGGALLGSVGWRGIFAVLAGAGLLVFVATVFGFRDTGSPRKSNIRVADMFLPLRSPDYVRAAVVCVVSFAEVIVYIGTAPALLRGHYGLSGIAFGGIFAITVLSLVLGTRVAPIVLRNGRIKRPLAWACGLGLLGALITGAVALTDQWPPLGVAVGLLALTNGVTGVLIALSATEALSVGIGGAGIAAGLLGGLQFGGGALLASAVTAVGIGGLTGIAGEDAVFCVLSLLVCLTGRSVAVPVETVAGAAAEAMATEVVL